MLTIKSNDLVNPLTIYLMVIGNIPYWFSPLP